MSANVCSLQVSLFGVDDEPAVDDSFAGLRRIDLDGTSWLDHVPGWLSGEQRVFDHLVAALEWHQRTVTMWERRLPEPRLTAWWTAEQGPEAMPVLAAARRALSVRYAEAFDSIGFNCYRCGDDSVAWHGDRHRLYIDDPVVAIVSVGAARPLRVRPRGGGAGAIVRPRSRRSVRDGRRLPARLGAQRPEGPPRRAAHLDHVPARAALTARPVPDAIRAPACGSSR